jgi:hypothetical protein
MRFYRVSAANQSKILDDISIKCYQLTGSYYFYTGSYTYPNPARHKRVLLPEELNPDFIRYLQEHVNLQNERIKVRAALVEALNLYSAEGFKALMPDSIVRMVSLSDKPPNKEKLARIKETHKEGLFLLAQREVLNSLLE